MYISDLAGTHIALYLLMVPVYLWFLSTYVSHLLMFPVYLCFLPTSGSHLLMVPVCLWFPSAYGSCLLLFPVCLFFSFSSLIFSQLFPFLFILFFKFPVCFRIFSSPGSIFQPHFSNPMFPPLPPKNRNKEVKITLKKRK